MGDGVGCNANDGGDGVYRCGDSDGSGGGGFGKDDGGGRSR